MNSSVQRLLLKSQIALGFFAVLCVAVLPKYVFSHNEGGFSNYGVHAISVIPFTLALLVCSVYIWRAANMLHRRLRFVLYGLSGLQVALLLSTYPYKINGIFDGIHVLVQIVLFVYELVLATWLALKVKPDAVNKLFFGMQLVAVVVLKLTLSSTIHILFIGQLLDQAAFGVVLVRSCKTA